MPKHEFTINGETIECSSEKRGRQYEVKVLQRTFTVTPTSPGLFSVLVDGQVHSAAAVVGADGSILVDIKASVLELREPSDEDFAGGAGDHGEEKGKIFAPMPGKIVKLQVKVGDIVEPRQQVVIVEAMKMENPVVAKARGKVKAVHFAVGDQVDTESPIVELELEEDTAKA